MVNRRFFLAGAAGSVLSACGGGETSLAPKRSAAAVPVTTQALPALGTMVLQQAIYEGWHDGPPFDPYTAYAERGVQWARTLITTHSFPELDALPVNRWRELGWQNDYWSCLEMGAAVLTRAAAAGMRLHLALFMSDQAADAGPQKRPAAWAGLSDAQLVAQVRAYAGSVAAYFKARGLNIDVFEIGNETDFGFCGWRLGETIPIPPNMDTVDTPDWMYENVWSKCVPLYKAAIEGIHAEMPDAQIALHIAGFGYSTANRTPIAFFTKMKEAGVAYDIAGLSYPYPTSGQFPQPYFAQQEFIAVFDAIKAIGKRAQILEFSYPSYAVGAPNFDASQAAYGCTPEAQATFIRDLAQALRGRAERILYWAGDVFPGINGPGGLPADIETYSLFSNATTPMPALDAMERLAADRLMDWAQQEYPALFPDAPSSSSFAQYYYRYHSTSGMYVGIEETTRSIVLHDGVSYNLANLGPLRSLIGWAG